MRGVLHVIGTPAMVMSLRPANLPKLMVGVSTLLAVSGRIVSMAELVDWIYGDDPDGGPDDPEQTIRDAIRRLRRLGLPIKTHGVRRGFVSGYRYEPDTSPGRGLDITTQVVV